jgi:hypothetical protein
VTGDQIVRIVEAAEPATKRRWQYRSRQPVKITVMPVATASTVAPTRY